LSIGQIRRVLRQDRQKSVNAGGPGGKICPDAAPVLRGGAAAAARKIYNLGHQQLQRHAPPLARGVVMAVA
jgi:hypothetical protein